MTITIRGCARCHGDGHTLEFEPLLHPVEENDGSVLTHWATCPATGQPILLGTTEEGLASSGRTSLDTSHTLPEHVSWNPSFLRAQILAAYLILTAPNGGVTSPERRVEAAAEKLDAALRAV
jgi:hypothetical protein